MKTIFDRFVTFVSEQEPERTIDHSGSWDDCAIGDFFNETEDISVDYTRTVGYQLPACGFPENVIDFLGNPYSKNTAELAGTYGTLAVWLEDNKENSNG